jgi:hypothetical protein
MINPITIAEMSVCVCVSGMVKINVFTVVCAQIPNPERGIGIRNKK